MALQSVGGLIDIPSPWSYGSSGTNIAMNDSGDVAAAVFQAPLTGNIDQILFATGTVTTSDTIAGTFVTVDSSGDPTSTAFGSAVKGTVSAAASTTIYPITLATPAAVTQGNTLALKLSFDSYVAGNLNIQYMVGAGQGSGGINFPYATSITSGGVYTKSAAGMPNFAIRYEGGTYHALHSIPALICTAPTVGSGSTPNHIGNLFTPAFSMKVKGFWAAVDIDNAADMILYDSDGSTVLETHTFTTGHRAGTSLAMHRHFFSSDRTLTAGQTYRVVLKPTSASTVGYGLQTGNASYADALNMMSMGTTCYQTTCTSPGTWTNNTHIRVSIGLIVSQLSDNVGSGGGFFGG